MTETFSRGQLLRFWPVYIISSSLFFIMPLLFLKGGFEGWIGYLLSFPLLLLLTYFAVYVGQIDPSNGWLKSGSRIVGKSLHIVFSSLVFYFIFSITLYSMIGNSVWFSNYLGETPKFLVILVYSICPVLLAYYGIRSIIYFMDSLFFLTIPIFVFFLVFLSAELDYSMSISLLTHFNIPNIAFSSIFPNILFGELVILMLLLTPYFRTVKRPVKTLAISHSIIIILHLGFWITSLFLFGPYLPGHFQNFFLIQLNHITLRNFFESFDLILFLFGYASIMGKMALLLYLNSEFVRHYFQISKRISSLIPFIVTMVILILTSVAVEYPSLLEKYRNHYYFSLLGIQFVPLIYFIVYRIRFANRSFKV